MCEDTYIAFRAPIGSQKDHIPVLEELDHYSLSYGTIFMVKMLHFWPKVKHRSTLYDRPSLKTWDRLATPVLPLGLYILKETHPLGNEQRFFCLAQSHSPHLKITSLTGIHR